MKRSERKMVLVILTTMVLTALLLQCNPASAQFRGSVVAIETPGGGRGSGFYVTRHLIMTNAHVVDDRIDGDKVIVMRNYVRYWGQVVAEDTGLDLALVKVESSGPMPFKFCDKVKRHQDIYIWTYDYGRFTRKIQYVQRVFAHKVTTHGGVIPGNSGSPAINEKGLGRCVAGVVRAYRVNSLEGILISSIYAQRFLDEFLGEE
jgi:S1-C subfamily serine protease